MSKDGIKYLSQEFDSNVLDSVKQTELCQYEYMIVFEKFKEELLGKVLYFVIG